jgi:glutaredoxin-related protein
MRRGEDKASSAPVTVGNSVRTATVITLYRHIYLFLSLYFLLIWNFSYLRATEGVANLKNFSYLRVTEGVANLKNFSYLRVTEGVTNIKNVSYLRVTEGVTNLKNFSYLRVTEGVTNLKNFSYLRVPEGMTNLKNFSLISGLMNVINTDLRNFEMGSLCDTLLLPIFSRRRNTAVVFREKGFSRSTYIFPERQMQNLFSHFA